MIIEAITRAWSDVAADAITDGLRANHCILGTRTLLDVCRHLGIEAQAVPTQAMVVNRAAVPLVHAGIPWQEWPPEAWSVGASPDSTGDGYRGHLVLVADVDERRFLIDSSTGQFRRAEYGMNTPLALSAEIDPGWPYADPKQGIRFSAPGWEMFWHPEPWLGKRHRSAPDWKRRSPLVDPILDRLSPGVRQ